MEKTVQFILEQQAQLTGTVERLSVKVDRNDDGINALLAIAEIHEREIQAHQQQMQAQGRRIQGHGREMTNTDERLKALINTAERFISEGREGKRG